MTCTSLFSILTGLLTRLGGQSRQDRYRVQDVAGVDGADIIHRFNESMKQGGGWVEITTTATPPPARFSPRCLYVVPCGDLILGADCLQGFCGIALCPYSAALSIPIPLRGSRPCAVPVPMIARTPAFDDHGAGRVAIGRAWQPGPSQTPTVSQVPRSLAYTERTYHPDRLLHPLKRNGPKGSWSVRTRHWDEALSDIARRLQSIVVRDPKPSHLIAIMRAPWAWCRATAWRHASSTNLALSAQPHHLRHRRW